MKSFYFRSIVALAAMAFFSSSNAAVVVTAMESSGNVVFSMDAGGSLDLSGLSFVTEFGYCTTSVHASSPSFSIGGRAGEEANDCVIYTGILSPTTVGSGAFEEADAASGSFAFFAGGSILTVDPSYVSGSILGAASAEFYGHTFVTLGLTEGTHVWTLPNDTIALSVVPIPAAAWLFGSALAGLGWMRRKA